MSDEQIAVRMDCIREYLVDQFHLSLFVKVDHDVSAEDYVRPVPRGRICKKIVNSEIHRFANLRRDLKGAVRRLQKVGLQVLGRHMAKAPFAVDAFTRPLNHFGADIRADYLRCRSTCETGRPICYDPQGVDLFAR